MASIRRILVTGSAGLIGSAVCRLALEQGLEVIGTWLRREPPALGDGLTRMRIDLSREAPDGLAHVDAVVHAAARVPSRFDESADAAESNWRQDQTIFAFARSRNAVLVFLSGTSLYQAARTRCPIDERAAVDPSGDYLSEKLRAEQLGRAMESEAGPRFVVLRVSAPYGPGQQSRTVLNTFVDRALRGGPIRYHGTGSREQTFTFVDDVARAALRAAASPGGTFNIAGPAPITMRELAELTCRVAGLDPAQAVPSGEPDPQEGRLARYDTRRAAELLEWTPRVDLAEGLAILLRHRRAPA